jgi:hypothetical protein
VIGRRSYAKKRRYGLKSQDLNPGKTLSFPL